jgi:hypothetical protein
MSLKSFHYFFITISGALGLLMSVWGFGDYRSQGGIGNLALGLSGVVLLLFLIPYIRWFKIKMSKISSMSVLSLSLGMALSISPEVMACSMCSADPNSLLTKGINGGILFLILVVGGVLGSILTVLISWVRRARLLKASSSGHS